MISSGFKTRRDRQPSLVAQGLSPVFRRLTDRTKVLCHPRAGFETSSRYGGVLAACAFVASSLAIVIAAQPVAQTRLDQGLVSQGRDLFVRVWTAPEGLGPMINARSCSGCHATPEIGGSGTDERSFVAIVPTILDPTGGHVFRRLRVSMEGAVTEQSPPGHAVIRKAPALFGSSVIETISRDEIERSVRPEAGSSGRVPDGRFGWKGRLATIEIAVAAAFVNELGLGSSLYPDMSSARRAHDGIELTGEQVRAVSAFVRALPAPVRRDSSEAQHGRQVFDRIGCVQCHRPSFPALESRGLFPYTDLLLHDMGLALADGLDEGRAKGDEFRTPPLWGITKTGPPYLHDGRANNLHEAIVAHGGDAEASGSAYTSLSAAERNLLLAFLRSL